MNVVSHSGAPVLLVLLPATAPATASLLRQRVESGRRRGMPRALACPASQPAIGPDAMAMTLGLPASP